jgi:hypothetical protein
LQKKKKKCSADTRIYAEKMMKPLFSCGMHKCVCDCTKR